MADKLDKLIAEAHQALREVTAEIGDLERRRDILSAQIEAFTLASAARPINGPALTKRGRQPGAISGAWKEVLGEVHKFKMPVAYAVVGAAAESLGMKVDPSAVRDRVRAFVKAGLMEGDSDTGFRVTDDAATRFGFDLPDPSFGGL